MKRQSLISRRRVLAGVGAGATIALAGCSGNSQDGDGSGEDEPENTTAEPETSSEPTQTETTTARETETPTETESQFSTEGNDSELIDKSAAELVLTDEDLDNYSTPEMSGERGDSADSAYRNFERNGESAFRVDVFVLDGVSEAEVRYNRTTLERIAGASPSNLQRRQLDIAVESEYTAGNFDENHIILVKFRDANAVGSVTWGTSEDSVSLQEIGEIAVEMHEKWR